eukprot:TRINITY_DN11059_c0_g2_i1.p1 TRINITY_DN11059_c0_g2~~TRINITY_DN11059_c0_g2_i1.p1  ORF type:complete len:137 (-),score=13.53 TRINITY_DN11059_c0_g2_i1:2-412(-)
MTSSGRQVGHKLLTLQRCKTKAKHSKSVIFFERVRIPISCQHQSFKSAAVLAASEPGVERLSNFGWRISCPLANRTSKPVTNPRLQGLDNHVNNFELRSKMESPPKWLGYVKAAVINFSLGLTQMSHVFTEDTKTH